LRAPSHHRTMVYGNGQWHKNVLLQVLLGKTDIKYVEEEDKLAVDQILIHPGDNSIKLFLSVIYGFLC
jgi:hypothetical protein